MLGLKPIKLLPARERVASALRKAIISKSIPEGAELTLENQGAVRRRQRRGRVGHAGAGGLSDSCP